MLPAIRLTLACLLLSSGAVQAQEPQHGQQQAPSSGVSVTTATPVIRDIDYSLSALGSIESINHPTLSAETSGRITRLHADVGSRVSAGARLADIDNTLLKLLAV